MGLGSGIRDKTYSRSLIRVQGQKGTGSRIRNWIFFVHFLAGYSLLTNSLLKGRNQ
jgi:hypothetical protein